MSTMNIEIIKTSSRIDSELNTIRELFRKLEGTVETMRPNRREKAEKELETQLSSLKKEAETAMQLLETGTFRKNRTLL